MRRLASTLVLTGGAAVLCIWIASPASSSPPRVPQPPAPTVFDSLSPELTEINQESARLMDRQSVGKNYPAPTRDPFTFGAGLTRPTTVEPTVPIALPSLPRLAAILTNATDAGVRYTAVFDSGVDVTFASVGDTIGAFVVDRIESDSVLIRNVSTSARFGVSLH